MGLADYEVEVIQYQRVLSHPIVKTGFVPETNSEIFVKSLPLYVSDEELYLFFHQAGEIFKIRLMLEEPKSNKNRGFCYVEYMRSQFAKKAIDFLREIPFKGEFYLNIQQSLQNCRLFLGGIPTNKTKDQVWKELLNVGVHNITDVIMYRPYSNRAENRGYVFVEFLTHEQAAHFRAKYNGVLRLWDKKIVLDWSLPLPIVDEKVLQSVKVIYLRNLEVTLTPEAFSRVILRFMKQEHIQKIYKFKNYAFVHVTTRPLAEHLMSLLKVYYKGSPVEVDWSKPPCEKTSPLYRQAKVNKLTRSRNNSTSSSIKSGFEDNIKFMPSQESILARRNLIAQMCLPGPSKTVEEAMQRYEPVEYSNASNHMNDSLLAYTNAIYRDLTNGMAGTYAKPRYDIQPLIVQTSSPTPLAPVNFFVPLLTTANSIPVNTSVFYPSPNPRYYAPCQTPNSLNLNASGSPSVNVLANSIWNPPSPVYQTRMSSGRDYLERQLLQMRVQNQLNIPTTQHNDQSCLNQPTLKVNDQPCTSQMNLTSFGKKDQTSINNMGSNNKTFFREM